MPKPQSPILGTERIRSSFLAALLVFALGVTGFVTHRAYTASREHRAIVERVINDYVAVASYQLGNATQIALHGCLRYWLGNAADTNSADAIRLDGCEVNARSRFELDLRARAFHATGAILSGELVAWLQDTIPQHATVPYDGRWEFGMLTHGEGRSEDLIVFAVRREAGAAARVFGFVSPSPLRSIIRQVVAQSHMLPPDLTRGVPDSLYFDVKPYQRADAPRQPGAFSRTSALGPAFGDIDLHVTLKQASLDRIVSGGMPANRGWELLSLLALAISLVVCSLMLLRRESQLARMRAGFVSSVSHELRTPLAQIRMFAEMLLLGRVRNEADERRSLEIIDKEARRLTQLVENVLQVARSENGRTRLQPAEAALAPIVRETAETFMILAEVHDIDLRLELEDTVIVPVDGGAVRQIVLNLLDNAAKYGPKGQRITVGLSLLNHVARLWVDDEGPGVPARERERVFEPFYRARQNDPNVTGSGIGLAVVRELTALHGGSCRIEEAPIAGARVVVEFPGAYVAAQQSTADWAVA